MRRRRATPMTRSERAANALHVEILVSELSPLVKSLRPEDTHLQLRAMLDVLFNDIFAILKPDF
jgi:hypothetical protein